MASGGRLARARAVHDALPVTKRRRDEEEAPRPKPPPKVGTSLAAALKGVTLSPKPTKPAPTKPAPPPALRPAPAPPPPPVPPVASAARPSDTLVGGERSIYYEAMRGVRRIAGGERARAGRVVATPPPAPDPAERQRDEEVRARLRSLVGGGLRFDLREEDDHVEALAEGTPESVMRQLLKAVPSDLPRLDLHGAREHEVEGRVSRFVRDQQRRGVRRLLVIHGKGLHSGPEGPRGRSILGRASVTALTEGGAAPLVRAFVSAPSALGGTGALLVELR
jgi:DNA-nicking Smr family endonuclease